MSISADGGGRSGASGGSTASRRRRSAMGRAASRVRGLLIDSGVLPYRPIDPHAPGDWDDDYGTGGLDYYGSLPEAPRYGVLIAWLSRLGQGAEILDVGCGTGLLRRDMGGIDFERYVGIDLSEVAIKEATAQRFAKSTFLVAGAPPPAEGPFDIVVCNEMLCYPDDAGAFLDSVRAQLKPGGFLLSSMWRHRGDRALFRLIDHRFTVVESWDLANRRQPSGRHRLALHRRDA